MTDTDSLPIADARCAEFGRRIPTSGYCDQPYVVRANDGAWVCVVTTAPGGHEGMAGQGVVSLRSPDEGRSWEAPVPLEPFDGPEASYAVLLKTPGGRIYAFYNHNTDRVREIPREDGGVYRRVDCLGHYVFKYSDDNGRSWSAERHEVPIRRFACDLNNPFRGELRYFWNVGRPIISADGSVFLPHSKVGSMGAGFYAQSEGVFLHSPNLLTERDPARIAWRTLPDGEVGLRPPAVPGAGRVAEEHTLVELSDGSLYSVYRTLAGHPACSYSRDRGRRWTPPEFKRFHPAGGRLFKHPRAANFVWKCGPGRYLYWFHNQGGPAVRDYAHWIDEDAYQDRNPAWVSAGREIETADGLRLAWSEPEILLYDDDPGARLSYPDLLAHAGRFWVTETQKTVARVHAVEPRLLDMIFRQHMLCEFVADHLLLHCPRPGEEDGRPAFPRLPPFRIRNLGGPRPCDDTRRGFTLDFLWEPGPESTGEGAKVASYVLLDTFTDRGAGLRLSLNARGALTLEMADARQHCSWTSDPLPRGEESGGGRPVAVSVIVDGGPRVILFVVDGVLHDGGDSRQFGWGRFSHSLVHANGAASVCVAPGVRELRVYGRALLVSEAVGHFRAHGRLRQAVEAPAGLEFQALPT